MPLLLIESLRRILAALLLLVGTVCFWFLDGPWITVQLVDFAENLKNSSYFVPEGTTVESFREQRTKGRTVETRSETWHLLAQQLGTGTLPGALHRMDMGRERVAWVVPPGALPPTEQGEVKPDTYVRLEGTDAWLWVQHRTAREMGDLPGAIKNPFRAQAWLFLLAAVAVYILLPRRKPGDDEQSYSRAGAVVVPDWLGFIMSAFFLSIGMLVINNNCSSLDGGWGWFAAVIALMSLFCLLLPGIANYYATWHLRILERGLAITRWGTERLVAWDSILSTAPYRGKAHWVIGLLLIFAARGPGMAGQGLLVMSNQEQGIELQLANGRKVRIMANAFPGFEAVTDALRARGLFNPVAK
jgi:hypothetical protein